MTTPGIAISCTLPDKKFDIAWDGIKIPEQVKARLIAQALLALTVRQKLAFEVAPIHGLILLSGPPGTGKTTIARGLANEVAKRIPKTKTTFIQIDPHALANAALGQSQKAVTKLFEQTIPEAGIGGVAIVLLDEVETLAADRQKLSLEANPVDVHRATDAFLAGIDRLTREHKNILIFATTNFPEALDKAVTSRADLVEDMGMPDRAARLEIIQDTLQGIASQWPDVKKLLSHAPAFAAASEGLDGRKLRKAIFMAAATSTESAKDLNKLSTKQIEQVLTALVHQEARNKK